jgi:hypothetical protein
MLPEEGTDLFVGGLREVVVPLADGGEVRRRFAADDLVHFIPQFGACSRGRDRHGDYDPAGALLTDCGDGCPHSGPGGQAVIRKNGDPALHGRRATVPPVFTLAARELAKLAGGDGVDYRLGDAEAAGHIRVDDTDTAGGDGTHRKLFVARDTEFADEENVERNAEIFGDRRPDRNTTPREGEDDDVRPSAVVPQSWGEIPSSILAIREHSHRMDSCGKQPLGS